MRAAIDTNVFVSLFAGDEETSPWAQRALEEIAIQAALVISPAVYAELVAGREDDVIETFLSNKGIEVSWGLGKDVWHIAGSRYGDYSRNRKRQSSRQNAVPGPRRILADFLIGAHALYLGDKTLLTTDTKIFTNYFPELRLIAP